MESKLLEEIENTSKFESVTWIIQTWVHKVLNHTTRIRKALHPIHPSLVFVHDEVNKLTTGIRSFEEYQNVLFSKAFLESLSKILIALPREKLMKTHLTKISLSRQISLSLLISKYPMEMLAGSSKDNSVDSLENGPKEVKECIYASELLSKYFLKMLSRMIAPQPKGFRNLITSFLFTLQYFVAKFNAWKTFDSQQMVQSLEEAFQQSYYNSLLSKIAAIENPSLRNDPNHAELIHSADYQVHKIRETLEKLLGQEKASSRLEELRAAVELSIPNYTRYFTNKDINKGMRYPSPNTSAKQEKIAEQVMQHTTTTAAATATTTTVKPAPSTELQQSPGKPITNPVNHTAEKSKVQVYLDALSKYMGASGGLETERLAHEITYDKNYRLPSPPTKSFSSLENDTAVPATIEAVLKQRMLTMMADQLINSLRMSKITSFAQVQAGMIVPVKMPSMTALGEMSIHTAKILRVYTHHTFPSSDHPVPHQKTAEEDEDSDEDKQNEAEEMLFMDVEFLLDGQEVLGMPIQFVKLASELPSPTLLIHFLEDLIRQIAHYLPPRSDLHQQLLSLLDSEIMTQLFAHYDTFQPFQDLFPLLKRIYLFVLNLQAEYRIEEHMKWLQEYENVFESAAKSIKQDEMNDDFQNHPLYVQAKGKVISLSAPASSKGDPEVKINFTLEKIVPLLPMLFEKVTQCLEEFQYDMANYYIGLVAPLLASSGHSFLASRFQTRLANRQDSIQSTTQWLLSTLQTSNNNNRWQQSVQDLVEAEVFPASTQTMLPTDLLTLVPPTSTRWTQSLVALALVTLLQYPIRLDAPPPPPPTATSSPSSSSASQWQYHRLIPETFSFDLTRLAKLRDLIDSIALESALLITTRQLLASRFRIMPKEAEEIELAHRLDVLLGQQDVQSSFLSAEIVKFITSVVETRRKESSSSLSSSGNASPVPRMMSQSSSPATTPSSPAVTGNAQSFLFDEQELVGKVEVAIKEVVSPGNAVLALFTKRVYKILLRGLLNQPYLPKLAAYSLHHKSQERNISKLIELGKRLFTHNLKIHEELYQNILLAYLASTSMASSTAQ